MGLLHQTLPRGSGYSIKEGLGRLKEPGDGQDWTKIGLLDRTGQYAGELTVAVVACTRSGQSTFYHGGRTGSRDSTPKGGATDS